MRLRVVCAVAAAIGAVGLGFLLVGRHSVERGKPARSTVVAPALDSELEEPRVGIEVTLPTAAETKVVGREPVQGPVSEAATPRTQTTGRVEVLVLSEPTREPIAGRRLVVFEPAPKPDWSIEHVDASTGDLEHAPRTDSSGRATFVLPPGSYRVVCPDRGFSFQEGQLVEDLTAGETRELFFSISTFDCFGRVENALTREAIVDASVALREGTYLSSAHVQRGELHTNARGVFQAEVLANSAIDATVSAPGYAPERVTLAPGHETEERTLLVLLRPFCRLRAELRDANGSSLAGVEVRLLNAESFLWGTEPEVLARARTDVSGTAVLESLPPAQPLLPGVMLDGALRTGFAKPLILVAGEERRESWAIGGCTIIGRVLDQAGEPVSDQIVWVEPAMEGGLEEFPREPALAQPVAAIRSDDVGAFAFSDLAPGSWWVGLAEDVFSDAALPPVRVEMLAGENTENVVLRSPLRGPSIRGHVEDEQGQRVSIWVSASGPMDLRAETDEQGAFELGPLFPGSYTVEAFDGDRSGTLTDVLAGADDVRLVLLQGFAVEGEIVGDFGAKGQALLGGPSLPGFSMTPVKNGRFRFGNLSPATYGLVVRLDDGRCALRTPIVVEGSNPLAPLQIEVSEGARLRIVRKEPDQELLVRVDGVPAGMVLGSSSSQELVLPPGLCTIEAFAGSALETLPLAAGESREVEIQSEK